MIHIYTGDDAENLLHLLVEEEELYQEDRKLTAKRNIGYFHSRDGNDLEPITAFCSSQDGEQLYTGRFKTESEAIAWAVEDLGDFILLRQYRKRTNEITIN